MAMEIGTDARTFPPDVWTRVKEFAILLCPDCGGQCKLDETEFDMPCWLDDYSQWTGKKMSAKDFYALLQATNIAKKHGDTDAIKKYKERWDYLAEGYLFDGHHDVWEPSGSPPSPLRSPPSPPW